MIEVRVKDEALRKAAGEDMDAFVGCFVTAIHEAIGGELTTETMAQLNADQITLLAWQQLHFHSSLQTSVPLYRNPEYRNILQQLCSMFRRHRR